MIGVHTVTVYPPGQPPMVSPTTHAPTPRAVAATRFYLPATGTTPISPAYAAGWGNTSAAARRPLTRAATNTAAVGVGSSSSLHPVDILVRQFVSEALPAQTIAGTFTFTIGAYETSSGNDDYLQVRLRVVDATGATTRGVLYDGQAATVVSASPSAPNYEFGTTSAATRSLVAVPVAPVAALAGDRLVVEVGMRRCVTGSTSRSASMTFGDPTAGGDLTTTPGPGAVGRPWLEFSQDLFLTAPGVPTAVAETHGPETITLTWAAPATGGAPDHYDVRLDGGTPTNVGTATSHTFTGLTSLTAYTVEVRAANTVGASAWVALTVTTAAQPPTDISCLVDDVSIRHGRQDTASQAEPSSATVNITVGPGAPLPPTVDIGAWLVIATTVGGQTYTRFTGRLTDVSVGWDDAGDDTPEAGVGQLVAVSVLADYARRLVGDEPFPQELDGARIARVFALAGLDLDPATSDPGTVQVIPRDVDAKAALEVAQGTATSAGGLIWETTAGNIRYADSEHRRGADVDMDLTACDVLVSPTWNRNLSGMVNEVSLGYGVAPENPAEGESTEAPRYRAVNTDSQNQWGRYEHAATTELATLADVTALASLILVRNGSPVWMLAALPVDVFGLDAAATQQLMGLDVHSLVRVSGLPATGTTPTSVAAWVEGWSERLAWGVHDLEITVSDYCRTAPPPRWNDVASATTWDEAAGTWNDMACMGMPAPSRGHWDDVPASTRWDQVSPDTTWDATTTRTGG